MCAMYFHCSTTILSIPKLFFLETRNLHFWQGIFKRNNKMKWVNKMWTLAYMYIVWEKRLILCMFSQSQLDTSLQFLYLFCLFRIGKYYDGIFIAQLIFLILESLRANYRTFSIIFFTAVHEYVEKYDFCPFNQKKKNGFGSLV